MADRSPIIGIAAVTLFATAVARVVAGAAAPAAAKPAQAAAAEGRKAGQGADSALSWGTACDLLWVYYGGPAPARPRGRCTSFPPVRASATVVVLPDPFESHLDWLFDSGLESVRRAYERQEFTLDRYWLPWTPGADSAASGAGRWRTSGLHRRQPGVLVFRRGSPVGCDTLGVVFVVGETPTQGIFKPAFEEALRERDSLVAVSRELRSSTKCERGGIQRAAAAGANAPDTVRVIGPIFSGSSATLERALGMWIARDPARRRARVVTGGANAPSNRQALTYGGGIEFQSMVNGVDVALGALTEALEAMDVDPAEVAYLRESTTQFGKAADAGITGDPVAGKRASDTAVRLGDCSTAASGRIQLPAMSAADRRVRDSTCARMTALSRTPLQIPFPLNISQLRAAYARLPQTPAPDGATPQAAPGTPLDLTDASTVRETPPVTSDLTAPMVELTLNDIVATLTLHRVKVVVIIATDVRDRLFLASQVKRRLPDVMTVLVGANSLYLRPELTTDLRGSLVVSSYPLIMESQFWDRTQMRDRQRFPFASDLAEGTYNATLHQLNADADMVDYGYPMSADSIERPPVWITTVGRTSFLPLTAVRVIAGPTPRPARPDDDEVVAVGDANVPPYAYERELSSIRIRPSTEPSQSPSENPGFLLLILVMAAGSLAAYFHSSGAWARAIDAQRASVSRSDKTPSKDERVNAFWRQHRSSLVLDREGWLAFQFCALFGALAPVVMLMFHTRIHGLKPFPGTSFVAVTLGIISTIVLLWVLWRAVSRAVTLARAGSRPDRGTLMRFAGLMVVGLAYFVLMSAFLSRAIALSGVQSAFFLLRALEFGNGVSPLMPLLLGGLILFGTSLWNLSRVRQLAVQPALESGFNAEGIDDRTTTTVKLGFWKRLRAWWEQIAEPRPDRGTPHQSLISTVVDIRDRLTKVAPGSPVQVLLICGLIGGLFLAWQMQSTPEALALPCSAFDWTISQSICRAIPAFDILLSGLIIAAMLLLTWDLVRFWSVWRALRECLEHVGATPIVGAFEHLPAPVSQLGKLSTFVPPGERLVNLTLDAAAQNSWAEYDRLSGRARREPPALRSVDTTFDVAVGRDFSAVYKEATEGQGLQSPSGDGDSRHVAQALAALYVIDYVEWVMRQLRSMAVFILGTIFLTILLLSSYPFEPESLIKVSFFVLMALTIGAMLSVIFQRNRNPTLRAMGQFGADEGTWNVRLIANLLVVLGVPGIALLSSTFPEVRTFLFAWIAPLLQALSRS